MKRFFAFALAAALLVPGAGRAQSDTSGDGAAAQDLMTTEELQDLVAPVALYPDTLLIQILVAATYPLDVVKADRLVRDQADASEEDRKAAIEAEGWDESVAVLAEAFPDVLADMAVHVEWTETMGQAMLAQSDDVMAAVQDMRTVANDNGALQSGDEQTVEVTQEGDNETIVIQPADPEVVYVPQYDPEVVYVDDGDNTGDLVAAGLITFGTVALINEIFDNDDHWHDYWGCRNCGGWGGGPIVRNPDIDIDVDGNVNIGNDIGWRPDDKRRDDARDQIRDKRDPARPGTLETRKPDRGDEMRQRLSKETGAADISRPGTDRGNIQRPDNAKLKDHKPAIDRTKARPQAGGGGGGAKAKAKVNKPAKAQKAVRKPSGGGQAMHKRAPAQRAHSGGNRGRASAGGRSGGRRR